MKKTVLFLAAFLFFPRAASSDDAVNTLTDAIAKNKAIEIIDRMIKEVPDINAKDNKGWTALITAARSENLVAVKRLIEAGANVNAVGKDDRTALMIACRSNERAAVVEALLAAGADAKAVAKSGLTALMLAGSNNKSTVAAGEMVEALIKTGAPVTDRLETGESALRFAIDNKNYIAVEILLRAGAVEDEKVLVISQAEQANPPEEYQKLEIKTGDVAPEEGGKLNVRLFESEVHYGPGAYEPGGGREVTWNLKPDPPPTLERPIRKHNLGELKAMINQGHDVNGRTGNGVTMAALAAGINKTEALLKALVEAGADLDAVETGTGRTPLINAARNEHGYGSVRYLLEQKLNVDAQDKYGMTALMYAANENQTKKVLEALINAGADVNAADQEGVTPLMYACSKNPKMEIIDLLIAGGASTSAKDASGRTVFDYAKGNPERDALEEKLKKLTGRTKPENGAGTGE